MKRFIDICETGSARIRPRRRAKRPKNGSVKEISNRNLSKDTFDQQGGTIGGRIGRVCAF